MRGHIPTKEWEIISPVIGPVLELGNKINSGGTYKSHFESLGFEHVSIDWNGLDGALRYDLRERLFLGALKKWCQYFGMVTNIGTSEHVIPQGYVWQNMLDALKVGGVLVCNTPFPGCWKRHQVKGQYPTEAFYHDLASMNGLTVEDIHIDRDAPRTMIYARFIKDRHVEDVVFDQELIYVNE